TAETAKKEKTPAKRSQPIIMQSRVVCCAESAREAVSPPRLPVEKNEAGSQSRFEPVANCRPCARSGVALLPNSQGPECPSAQGLSDPKPQAVPGDGSLRFFDSDTEQSNRLSH